MEFLLNNLLLKEAGLQSRRKFNDGNAALATEGMLATWY